MKEYVVSKTYITERTKVDITTGCWNWQLGQHNTKPKNWKVSYGSIGRLKAVAGGRLYYLAHQLAYALFNGPVPKNKLVCHRCDNPLCCNPKHLYLGTPASNTHDKMTRGRYQRQDGENNGNSKLTEAQVRKLRELGATGEYTFTELGPMFGVSNVSARNAIARKTWAGVV